MSGSLDGGDKPEIAWTLTEEWEKVRSARRIVIKIGSNLLTGGKKTLRRVVD